MHKSGKLLILATIFLITFGHMACAAERIELDLDKLISIPLATPEDPAQRQYLGITTGDSFTLPQIKAQAIILEIFNMYCPVCQASAPEINKLHQAIEKDPTTRDRIKLVGIGTGNSPTEISVFRKKFDIEFPLFPDKEFLVQQAFPKPLGTPTILILEKDGSGKATLLHSHVGKFADREEFFKIVAGLQRPR